MIPRTDTYILFTCLLVYAIVITFISGCAPLPPEIIIQTNDGIDAPCETVVLKEVTRLAYRMITPTPLPISPSPEPSAVTIYFAPRGDASGEVPSEEWVLYEQFADLLGETLGRQVRVVIPLSYRESIDALCSGDADLAWLATPAYLIAREQCGVEATFCVTRNRSSYYRGQIMVQADSIRLSRGLQPVTGLADLEGGSIAYTDPSSTTGHLFPKAMLRAAGVTPAEEIFVGGDAQAVLAVYRAQVDAAAGYWAPIERDGSIRDARATLGHIYPNVESVVRIIQLTDPIPNDPIVLRSDLPSELRMDLVAAIAQVGASSDGRELLLNFYGVDGLAPIDDSDYDVVRGMGDALEISYDRLLDRRYPF